MNIIENHSRVFQKQKRNKDMNRLSFKTQFKIEFLPPVTGFRKVLGHLLVITTAQLHSTEPELKFCAGSNPARGVSEIRDSEDFWQLCWLEIRLNTFRRSTIPQKQFIIRGVFRSPWNIWDECFYEKSSILDVRVNSEYAIGYLLLPKMI